MGSDMVSANPTDKELKFQSTLPGWGATRSWNTQTRNISISIHAPRMGSDDLAVAVVVEQAISIHAPRMGSDTITSNH